MGYRVTFRGREVRMPVVRQALAVTILLFGLLLLIFMVAILPLTLPLHGLFRLAGRQGFFREKQGGGITYSIDAGAFRRA